MLAALVLLIAAASAMGSKAPVANDPREMLTWR
jgi:hypothetical protein